MLCNTSLSRQYCGCDTTAAIFGADYGARTRYLDLGKVALYQNELNPQAENLYKIARLLPGKWCLRSESNQRHGDFQSPALPTELQRHVASMCVAGERNGDPEGTRTHGL